MGDRIAVIGHGRLQQVGTGDELLNRPVNLFMARFIGSPLMNLLRGRLERGTPATLVSDGFKLALDWQSALYAILPDTGQDVAVGETLHLGLDPERICLFDLQSERTLEARYSWQNLKSYLSRHLCPWGTAAQAARCRSDTLRSLNGVPLLCLKVLLQSPRQ